MTGHKMTTAAKREKVRRLSLAVANGKPLTFGERVFVWQSLDGVADHGLRGFLPKESANATKKAGQRLAIAFLFEASLVYSPAHRAKEARQEALADRLGIDRSKVKHAHRKDVAHVKLLIDRMQRTPGWLERNCETASKAFRARGPVVLRWLDDLRTRAAKDHTLRPARK